MLQKQLLVPSRCQKTIAAAISIIRTTAKYFDLPMPKKLNISAYQAAAHDAWFRAQVEQGVKEADDPNTRWVSNEAAKATSAKRRAAWVKKEQAGA